MPLVQYFLSLHFSAHLSLACILFLYKFTKEWVHALQEHHKRNGMKRYSGGHWASGLAEIRFILRNLELITVCLLSSGVVNLLRQSLTQHQTVK